jgi:SAM-dependent methyltransferase
MLKPLIYDAINKEVRLSIPPTASCILDIGCGNGALGALLKQNRMISVDGITYSEAEAIEARQHLDHVLVADLNNVDKAQLSSHYDCIICSHVLEHLVAPWQLVSVLESLLLPGGMLIIAIPNLLFFKQRWQLLRGRFTYSHKGGLMDITHLRFFDWQSADILYQHTQLQLVDKRAYGMFPQPLLRKIIPGISKKIDTSMVSSFPGLFGLQFIIRLTK